MALRSSKGSSKGLSKKTAPKAVKTVPKESPKESVKKPVKLGEKELELFRQKLMALKEEVATEIKHLSEDTLMKSQKDVSGDISGYGLHMADVASDNFERDFSLERVSDVRQVLLEINDALSRIDEGTFGQCQMCRGSVGKQRLDVLPYARYCKRCKEKHESLT